MTTKTDGSDPRSRASIGHEHEEPEPPASTTSAVSSVDDAPAPRCRRPRAEAAGPVAPVATLATVWSYYDTFSSRASERVRQGAYAGLAVIWIFREANGVHVPPFLRWPGFLFVLALALDFAHAVVGATTWRRFGMRMEREGVGAEQSISWPDSLPKPTEWINRLKIAAAAVAYILLLYYLARSL